MLDSAKLEYIRFWFQEEKGFAATEEGPIGIGTKGEGGYRGEAEKGR